MRIRRIAILIDGAYLLKRLPRLSPKKHWNSPQGVVDTIHQICKSHVAKLVQLDPTTANNTWLDHIYRIFYYDARPFNGVAHNPLSNIQICFADSEQAHFRQKLFSQLLKLRKLVLRLGKVTSDNAWHISSTTTTKRLLRTREWLHLLEPYLLEKEQDNKIITLTSEQKLQLRKTIDLWNSLSPDHVKLGLSQKGVDMRIGVDITTLTLKRQVDTIILITGDSDFVPAAKVARREGVEFILDPLWQSINDDLREHVDGIVSTLPKPTQNS